MIRTSVKEDIERIDDIQLQTALTRLPAWRRTQALRFKHHIGKVECAFSYLMLCDLLHEAYGISIQPTFIIGEHGKPALKEFPHLHFNMSHCHAGIAVSVSDHPVGIDIERIGRDNDILARRVLNEAEYQQMQTSPTPSITFTELWTQKEAVFKLLATGITDDIRNLLSSHPDISITTHTNLSKGYSLSIASHEEQQILAL